MLQVLLEANNNHQVLLEANNNHQVLLERNQLLVEIISEQNEIKSQNNSIKSQQNEIKSQQNAIISQLNEIKSRNNSIITKLGNMERAALLQYKNPWFNMAETDQSKTSKLRLKVMNRLQKLKCPFECMLTKCQDIHKLKVAHILPDSTKKSIMNDLKLPSCFRNDTEAQKWNFMILRNDIEEAFDSLKISFVPTNILQPNDFYLNIIDRDSLDSDITGLEGSKLNVPEGISLSRRALSYQAYMAYIQATYNDPSVDLNLPLDFWSSEYDSRDAVRDRLAGLVTSSIRDESLEVDEDEYE